jgi:hypothetical protein
MQMGIKATEMVFLAIGSSVTAIQYWGNGNTEPSVTNMLIAEQQGFGMGTQRTIT